MFTVAPFPAFEGGFGFPPWDCDHSPPFLFEQLEEPVVCDHEQPFEPVMSNSGSQDSTNPKPMASNSGSDEHSPPITNSSNSGSDEHSPPVTNSLNSGSDDSKQAVTVIDERKKRRMSSNRESAKRSRMRKQKHLENLRNQVNRLRIENRELMNSLRFAVYHIQVMRRDNERLLKESTVLRQKLWDIRQVLLVRLLHQQLYASGMPSQ